MLPRIAEDLASLVSLMMFLAMIAVWMGILGGA
jgi:diacylglycerol kinase